MDVAGLRDRIQATLDPNAAIRQQAELDLKYVRAGQPPRQNMQNMQSMQITDPVPRPKRSPASLMPCSTSSRPSKTTACGYPVSRPAPLVLCRGS